MQYTATDFINLLYKYGYNFFTGVPCSNQKELLHAIQSDKHHYYSLNPGIAIALAAGAAFCGYRPVVLAQNTEIGDMLANIMMLFSRYELSGLLLTSYRKTSSEQLWGSKGVTLNKHTLPLVRLLELEHIFLKEDNYKELEEFLNNSHAGFRVMMMETNIFETCLLPTHFTKKESAINAGKILTQSHSCKQKALQETTAVELLAKFISAQDNVAAIISEGQLSRKFFEECDVPNVLALSCGLGYTSSIGAGVALCSAKDVFIIEGDGGFLMNVSILPFVGSQKISNYVHIIMNNGCYVSTGGQSIVNNAIDWDSIAVSFGYNSAITIRSEEQLVNFLADINSFSKPIFVNLQVLPSTFASPNISKAPGAIGNEFKKFLALDIAC